MTRERTTFHGRHYQLTDAALEPKPLQDPHPPIWIGGGPKSIGRAARYGQYIVPTSVSPEKARSMWIPRLQEEGTRWGTDPKLGAFKFAYVAKNEEDYRSRQQLLLEGVAAPSTATDPGLVTSSDPLAMTISGTPEVCAQRIRDLETAGVSHFLMDFQFHGSESVPFMMEQAEAFARDVTPLL